MAAALSTRRTHLSHPSSRTTLSLQAVDKVKARLVSAAGCSYVVLVIWSNLCLEYSKMSSVDFSDGVVGPRLVALISLLLAPRALRSRFFCTMIKADRTRDVGRWRCTKQLVCLM